jgi:hypothetical protein
MIVIYKLFVIGNINIITDIVNCIKPLWLTLETVVIAPPSLEEWENNKVFDHHPIDHKYDRYVLVKNNIMYISATFAKHWTTFFMPGREFDPIGYNVNDTLSIVVSFHQSNINPANLYYDQNLIKGALANEIVPFYHFYCNKND